MEDVMHYSVSFYSKGFLISETTVQNKHFHNIGSLCQGELNKMMVVEETIELKIEIKERNGEPEVE